MPNPSSHIRQGCTEMVQKKNPYKSTLYTSDPNRFGRKTLINQRSTQATQNGGLKGACRPKKWVAKNPYKSTLYTSDPIGIILIWGRPIILGRGGSGWVAKNPYKSTLYTSDPNRPKTLSLDAQLPTHNRPPPVRGGRVGSGRVGRSNQKTRCSRWK